MVCTDTQATNNQCRYFRNKVKGQLGTGSRVHYTPYKCHNGERERRVGGMFIIIGQKWGSSLHECKDEPSKLGILSKITLNTSKGKILIIGGYWPNRTASGATEQHHTLWQKTERWITSQKLKDNSPIDYIQRLTMRWAYKALAEQAAGVFLCGDLNSTWTRMEAGGGRTLDKWAADHQWINGPRLITDFLNFNLLVNTCHSTIIRSRSQSPRTKF